MTTTTTDTTTATVHCQPIQQEDIDDHDEMDALVVVVEQEEEQESAANDEDKGDDEESSVWTAPFFLDVALWSPYLRPSYHDTPAVIMNNFQRCDISKFLGGQQPDYTRLYLSPERYPPPPTTAITATATNTPAEQAEAPLAAEQQDANATSTTTTKGSSSNDDPPASFLVLKKDLETAAFQQCHFPLYSNGSSGRSRSRRFRCGACVNRANSKRYVLAAQRALEMEEDRLNDDSQLGQEVVDQPSMSDSAPPPKKRQRRRRRKGTRGVDKSCTFAFVVRWDEYGFFISLEKRSGCAIHRFHAQVDASSSSSWTIPRRLSAPPPPCSILDPPDLFLDPNGDPDDNDNDDNDDPFHGTYGDDSSSVGGGGGSEVGSVGGRLFGELLRGHRTTPATTTAEASEVLLDDEIRELENQFRKILSLYRRVEQPERDMIRATTASLVSQLKGSLSSSRTNGGGGTRHKKNNVSRTAQAQQVVVQGTPTNQPRR